MAGCFRKLGLLQFLWEITVRRGNLQDVYGSEKMGSVYKTFVKSHQNNIKMDVA
jgi:hypothetical protein